MSHPANTETIKPGEARCPGPSTKDIVLADGEALPEALLTESYAFLGDADVSYDAYTSKAFAERELKNLWPKVWQFACREEHLPNPNDSYVYDIGPYSVLIVRQPDGGLKAFINACKHRGMQLQDASAGTIRLRTIRCPFHGWSWGLDGRLLQIPCEWDFPHVDKARFALDEVRLECWAGFVFINLDQNAPPLAQYLEVLPDHFKAWPLQDRHISLHIEKTLPANWKLATEAFLEAYHVLATHPQGLPTAGDANAQYDVFGQHVSRFYHTVGFPSPHLASNHSQEDILASLGGEALGLKLDERGRARLVFADFLRSAFGSEMRVDLTNVSTSEMIDSIEYFLFPNFCVFPGISFPMVYRFRPDPDNVDRSIFDLYFLKPTPKGETPPPAPPPIKLGLDDLFANAAGLPPMLGVIYDQDTGNLARLTRGVKASMKTGQTLGNYQEVRIRHMRQTLDRYLQDDSTQK